MTKDKSAGHAGRAAGRWALGAGRVAGRWACVGRAG